MNNVNPILELPTQKSGLEQIADHLRTMGPEMKRMAGNEHETMDEALSLATNLKTLLNRLQPMFADKSGNLAEAQEYAGYILINLAAHKRDVEAGKE